MALFYSSLLLCCIFTSSLSIDDPGLFTPDMSRKADDWLPVAGCRADCLNVFGKNFGVTTPTDCIHSETCQPCWDGCACIQFNPSPMWPQCALPNECYAGCRWAKRHYVPDASRTRSDNRTSTWKSLFSVKLLEDDRLRFNNTLVDENGSIYKVSRHLVFSVSFKTGADRDWIQLYQPVNTISDIQLRTNVPECLHGCTFWTVVYNAENRLANATFWFEGAPRRVIVIHRNTTIQTDMDSSLSANLTWDTANHMRLSDLQKTITVEWTRTVSDSVQPLKVNRSETQVTLRHTNAGPWYKMEDLLYNTRYDVIVTQNTTDDSMRYQFHFATPGCRQTASEMRQCIDVPLASGQSRGSASSGLNTTLIAVSCVLVVGSSIAAAIMLFWRRSRAGVRTGDREALRTSPVPNAYASRPTSSMSAGREVRFLTTTPIPVLSTTLVVSDDLETNPLLTPTYEEIQQTRESLDKESLFHSNRRYVVKEGTFGKLLLAVKRAVDPRDPEAQERLRTEFHVLKHLRQCAQFARLLGSSVDGVSGCGFVILTRLEHTHTSPLRKILQMYRQENILRKLPDGTYSLRLAALYPNTASLGNLSGRVLMGMAEKIAYGIAYLNSKKLVHGALCMDNVVCDASFNVKIVGMSNVSDLNYASFSKYFNEAYCRWLPLEVLQYGVHSLSLKTDVWSFGVVLWEITTLGGVPYTSGNKQHLIEMLSSGYRLEQSPICNNIVHEFILECWKVSAEARPSMADIHEKLKCYTTLRTAASLFDFTSIGELESLLTNVVQGECDDEDEVLTDDMIADDVFVEGHQEVVPPLLVRNKLPRLPASSAVPKHLHLQKALSAPVNNHQGNSRLPRPSKLEAIVNAGLSAMASMGSSSDKYDTLD